VVVNLISALKTLKAKYGNDFVLTMAPETFFVQLGHQFYGPGPIMGLDGQYHTMGTADFHTAMTDMVLTGFPVAGDGHG